MRGLRVLVAISVATAGVLACEPITREDLECSNGRCLDASAAPPDSSQPDASEPGTDAALPGPDAGLDAAVPPDASSSADASCARLFSLGYPSGAVLDSPSCLRDLPRFLPGPCSGAGDCHLDSRAVYETPDGGLIESVTAGGKLWEYDGRTGAVLTNGVELSSLSYLKATATDPCFGKSSGCRFDSHTYQPASGGGWTESITNVGQMFHYEAFTHVVVSFPAANGSNLIALPRYSVGTTAPCYGKSITECRFQTQAYSRSGGKTWEWVTFDGSLWIFDAATGTQQTGSNTKLSQVARFASSICAGVADCRLRTHAFVAAPDGGIVESFSD